MADVKITDAEWIVMDALWAESPVSARDLTARLQAETGWAYTTVRTILSRLVEKGAVAVARQSPTSVYQPLVSRRQARRSALRALLDRAFDGTFGSLVQHLLKDEKLSAADRAKLAKMLDEVEGKS